MSAHNLFDSLQTFDLGNGNEGQFYSLPALEAAGLGNISRMPVCLRIVLESVLRNVDGTKVTEENVRELAAWQPNADRTAHAGENAHARMSAVMGLSSFKGFILFVFSILGDDRVENLTPPT